MKYGTNWLRRALLLKTCPMERQQSGREEDNITGFFTGNEIRHRRSNALFMVASSRYLQTILSFESTYQ
jgi:hypothetical protein